MQPYLFPYLGYFQLLHAADKFVFYDDVRYIRNGWINRNRILLQGEPRYLTVPVHYPGLHGRICDTQVSGSRWRRKAIETLRHAYSQAISYDLIFPLIRKALMTDTRAIADLARQSVLAVCAYLEIETDVIHSSALYGNTSLRGETRVLDICRRERADAYVNAAGGRSLYSRRSFEKRGISLRFLKTLPYEYPQRGDWFHADLSIIDILMSVEKPRAMELLGKYVLEP